MGDFTVREVKQDYPTYKGKGSATQMRDATKRLFYSFFCCYIGHRLILKPTIAHSVHNICVAYHFWVMSYYNHKTFVSIRA